MTQVDTPAGNCTISPPGSTETFSVALPVPKLSVAVSVKTSAVAVEGAMKLAVATVPDSVVGDRVTVGAPGVGTCAQTAVREAARLLRSHAMAPDSNTWELAAT